MRLIEETIFYKRATKELDDYVSKGGNVDDLTTKDNLYKYIKNSLVKDADGKPLNVEEKFELLGYPRKRKCSNDVKASLIDAIEEFLANGGTFHMERKKLPFYDKFLTYVRFLKRQGKEMTHEEIMKNDLGFKEYSDDYFRIKPLFQIYKYEDENGFVDDFKTDRKVANFVKDLAITYDVPYYFVILFLADRELKKYIISVDKVRYIERLLKNYVAEHKSFVGIKRKDPNLYEMFTYLTKYYSDGSEQRFSKKDWLEIFNLEDVDNVFGDTIAQENLNIDPIIKRIKANNPSGFIYSKDINLTDYRKIVKKSVAMGVSVEGLLNAYGLKCKGSAVTRLSRVYVKEVPYLKEMKQRFNNLILESGVSKEYGNCKEEIVEEKVKAMKQVYSEFK